MTGNKLALEPDQRTFWECTISYLKLALFNTGNDLVRNRANLRFEIWHFQETLCSRNTAQEQALKLPLFLNWEFPGNVNSQISNRTCLKHEMPWSGTWTLHAALTWEPNCFKQPTSTLKSYVLSENACFEIWDLRFEISENQVGLIYGHLK